MKTLEALENLEHAIFLLDSAEEVDQEQRLAAIKKADASLDHLKEVLGYTCEDEGCPHHGKPHAHK